MAVAPLGPLMSREGDMPRAKRTHRSPCWKKARGEGEAVVSVRESRCGRVRITWGSGV